MSTPGDLSLARDYVRLDARVIATVIVVPLLCISADHRAQSKMIFDPNARAFRIVNLHDTYEWLSDERD